jgi:hypothetical protein
MGHVCVLNGRTDGGWGHVVCDRGAGGCLGGGNGNGGNAILIGNGGDGGESLGTAGLCGTGGLLFGIAGASG